MVRTRIDGIGCPSTVAHVAHVRHGTHVTPGAQLLVRRHPFTEATFRIDAVRGSNSSRHRHKQPVNLKMDGSVIENLLQRLVTEILVGSIYGLLCTGLGMIFGVIRVINFAQGEFMMLGMYTTLFVGAAAAAALSLGPAAGAYLGMVVAALVLAGAGWALQRYLVSHVSAWMTSQSLDGYGQVMIYREALEKAGAADRRKVADVIRKLDSTSGAAEYFSGPLKWDERGRRVDAGLVIAQWRDGQPVAAYPAAIAQTKPVWPGK